MATATAEKTLFEQIEEVRQEAESFENEYQSKLGEAQESLTKRNEALKRMGELASEAAGEAIQPNSTTVAGPAPKRKVGAPAPKHAATPAKAAPAKRGPGRPAATERNYTNKNSLPEALWEILDRDPKTFKKSIKDYPDGANGLKVSEMRDIIEAEKKWVSSSDNISPQIQQAIGKLREDGKLARNEEDRRYYIVEGAELKGPKLDAAGKPIE